jgi:hypothetical protein
MAQKTNVGPKRQRQSNAAASVRTLILAVAVSNRIVSNRIVNPIGKIHPLAAATVPPAYLLLLPPQVVYTIYIYISLWKDHSFVLMMRRREEKRVKTSQTNGRSTVLLPVVVL